MSERRVGRGRAARAPEAVGRPLSGRRALELAASDLALRPLLLVTDFDGTVSQLVLDPWGARILPAARRALRRLAGLPDVHVVVLSGRQAADVAGRARVGGATYIGNHGLERATLPRGVPAERLDVASTVALEAFHDPVRRLADGVARLIEEDWLVVERKEPAVTFHYRRAPDVITAGRRVAAAVDRIDPERVFVRYPGRRALELRPPGAVAKGESMASLLEELHPASALVLGDDRSDAEAFAVLRDARTAGRVRGLALAVRARAEDLPEVTSVADLVLASPAEAARFLGGLAGMARETGSGTRPRSGASGHG